MGIKHTPAEFQERGTLALDAPPGQGDGTNTQKRSRLTRIKEDLPPPIGPAAIAPVMTATVMAAGMRGHLVEPSLQEST
jgi:hypothetical protein